MPDSALEATERQFTSLLTAAADGTSIDLTLYALPGVPRAGMAAQRVSQAYESTETLFAKRLDGLIVTGREPLMPNLQDEAYWASFTAMLEWARHNTHSAIWSCLAAHAAVLHMDGIKRIRSHKKHCGALHCRRITSHLLNEGAPSHFQLPHSRWNGLPEDQLIESGYQLLATTEDAGVDSFCKDEKSLFVFFQGHPEYETSTLLLEYRRDVGRYLTGESNSYPLMPRDYFDAETTSKLTAIQQEATIHRDAGVLAKVSEVLENATIENTWRLTAIGMYRRWLKYVAARKEHQARLETDPNVLQRQNVSPPGLDSVSDAILSAATQAPSTATADSRRILTIL